MLQSRNIIPASQLITKRDLEDEKGKQKFLNQNPRKLGFLEKFVINRRNVTSKKSLTQAEIEKLEKLEEANALR